MNIDSKTPEIKEGQRSIEEIFHNCGLFTVPIYQRNYSWNIKECRTLLSDVTDEEDIGHFTGSIVLYKSGNRYNIIDGQQRLTTITLLMLAIHDTFKELGQNDKATTLKDKYLIGNGEHKVMRLDGSDTNRDYIKSMITTGHGVDGCNASENYKFFKEQLSQHNNVDAVYKNLCKLKLVVILLSSKQNPQRVFESLNNTGIKLKESDLIRNYIFMQIGSDRDATFSQEIMTGYWVQIEGCIQEKHLDMFFRHFLSYKAASEDKDVKVWGRGDYMPPSKINKIIGELNIHDNFKHIYDKNTIRNRITEPQDKEECRKIMEDIKQKAQLYSILLGAKTKNSYSVKILDTVSYIVFLQQKTIYPVLLYILDVVAKNSNRENECLESLKLLERYIFRCIVTNSPALKRLGVDGIKMIQHFSSMSINKAIVSVVGSSSPSDKDIEPKFSANDFYKGVLQPHEIFYLFLRLDNNGHNVQEKLEDWHKTGNGMTGYTVEHIFPVKTEDKWNDIEKSNWLPGIDWDALHEKRNALGNLIITDRNYEAGTSPLKDKHVKYNDKGRMFSENKEYVDVLVKNNKYTTTDIANRCENIYNEFIKFWSDIKA